MMREDNVSRGAAYIVVSALFFSLMGALIKTLAQHASNEQIVFFRNAFSLMVLLPFAAREARRGGAAFFSSDVLRFHFMRSLFGLAAMYCFFFALTRIPIAEAVLLNYTTPLFTPAIAYFWLGERAGAREWAAIALGMVGVVFILKPGADIFSPVAGIGLLSGILAAVAMVSIRRMTATEPPTRIVFYFSAVGTLVSAFPLLWAWQPLSLHAWFTLAGIGVLATLGQFFMTKGYAAARMARVGPFTYSAVFFAAFFGWLLWDELQDFVSLLGTGLVIAGGALALLAHKRPDTPSRILR